MIKGSTPHLPLLGHGKQLKMWDQILFAHFIAPLHRKLTKGKKKSFQTTKSVALKLGVATLLRVTKLQKRVPTLRFFVSLVKKDSFVWYLDIGELQYFFLRGREISKNIKSKKKEFESI
jgi:hypothetical protein